MAVVELTNTFLAEMGTHRGSEQDAARVTILTAGALVAELAGPRRWEAFDARIYFARTDHLPPDTRVSAALVLAGFFGWLALIGLLDLARADAIIEAIDEHGPGGELLRAFCQRARRQMSSLADLVGRESA
jgi:hypothetical protein